MLEPPREAQRQELLALDTPEVEKSATVSRILPNPPIGTPPATRIPQTLSAKFIKSINQKQYGEHFLRFRPNLGHDIFLNL